MERQSRPTVQEGQMFEQSTSKSRIESDRSHWQRLVLCWATVLPFHGQPLSSSSVPGYYIAIPWTISVF